MTNIDHSACLRCRIPRAIVHCIGTTDKSAEHRSRSAQACRKYGQPPGKPQWIRRCTDTERDFHFERLGLNSNSPIGDRSKSCSLSRTRLVSPWLEQIPLRGVKTMVAISRLRRPQAVSTTASSSCVSRRLGKEKPQDGPSVPLADGRCGVDRIIRACIMGPQAPDNS
jgi:hypothetical protein